MQAETSSAAERLQRHCSLFRQTSPAARGLRGMGEDTCCLQGSQGLQV